MTMIDAIGFGGAEALARSIAMRLDRGRFESTFCVTRWDPTPEEIRARSELAAAGVSFLGLERSSALALRPWRELLAHLREHSIDVLHAHKLGSNAWGALLGPRAGVPVLVAQEHGVAMEGLRKRRIVDRHLIARRADAFVAVSQVDRRRMIEAEGIRSNKIRVIPNGIEAVGARTEEAMRAELGIPADSLVVGAVATPRPEKALDVLIRATAKLAASFPGMRVLIIGGPDSTQPLVVDELKALSRELGVTEIVTFMGLRLDVPDLATVFDVGVLCSDREASPLALMEYMAAGKPVVATRVGGIPEIVDDGVTGTLVEPRNPDSLAAALATLLRDPAMRARMGAAGFERRRREFDIDVTVGRFERLYEGLLEQHFDGSVPDRGSARILGPSGRALSRGHD